NNKFFAQMFVSNRLKDNGISIDVSKGDQEKWYGTLEFRDNQGQKLSSQTKELLIPTGEYLPYILTAFYKTTGQQKIIDAFAQNRQVHKGSPPQIYNHPNLIIGPVACSGILGRNIYRNL